MENQDLKELIELIDSYQFIGDIYSEPSIGRKVLDGLIKAFIDPIKEIIMQRSDSEAGIDNDIEFLKAIRSVVYGLGIFFGHENTIRETISNIAAKASEILDIDVSSAISKIMEHDDNFDVLINNIHVN